MTIVDDPVVYYPMHKGRVRCPKCGSDERIIEEPCPKKFAGNPFVRFLHGRDISRDCGLSRAHKHYCCGVYWHTWTEGCGHSWVRF